MSEVLEELHEECGVFGVYRVEDSASLTRYNDRRVLNYL